MGLCGFRCYPCVIRRVETSEFATCNLFWLICTARYTLGSLKISSGGTKFETIFRNQVGYLHFLLFRRAVMFDLLFQVMLLLIISGVIFIFVWLRQR